jgi:small subunit ribosomal protein S4
VNGVVTNIPSYQLKPGDVVSVKGKSKGLEVIQNSVEARVSETRKWNWLEWNPERKEGNFLEYPEREKIPEKINEQLIVELYSK